METILNTCANFEKQTTEKEFVSKIFKLIEKSSTGIFLKESSKTKDVTMVKPDLEIFKNPKKTENCLNIDTIEKLLDLLHGEKKLVTEDLFKDLEVVEKANYNDNLTLFNLIDSYTNDQKLVRIFLNLFFDSLVLKIHIDIFHRNLKKKVYHF